MDTYPESYITKYTSIRRKTPLAPRGRGSRGRPSAARQVLQPNLHTYRTNLPAYRTCPVHFFGNAGTNLGRATEMAPTSTWAKIPLAPRGRGSRGRCSAAVPESSQSPQMTKFVHKSCWLTIHKTKRRPRYKSVNLPLAPPGRGSRGRCSAAVPRSSQSPALARTCLAVKWSEST